MSKGRLVQAFGAPSTPRTRTENLSLSVAPKKHLDRCQDAMALSSVQIFM